MEKEIGELEEGLYKLHSHKLLSAVTQVHQAKTSTSQVTNWHCRLGHPSSIVLDHISCVPKTIDKSHYEICQLSKQVRLSFPTSSSVSQEIFDLVHCDVWGPYKHVM